MTNLTGNLAGTRQGSAEVVHTFPVNFDTTGISSGVLCGVIKASASNPVIVEVSAHVVTAFNAVTTNVLTVGTTTTATEWLVAADVAELTTGFYPAALSARNWTFTGVAAAGAITLTGAVKGDRVLSVAGMTTPGNAAASFESTISVVNQIQQSSASDLHLETYVAQLVSAGTANKFRLTSDTNVYIKYTQSGTAATTGSARIIIREFAENILPIA